MERNNTIPSEDELRWTEFLNGASDATDVSDLKRDEHRELASVWESTGNSFSYASANPDHAWKKMQSRIAVSESTIKLTKFKYHLFQYAALLVMIMAIGAVVYQYAAKKPQSVFSDMAQVVVQTDAHPSEYKLVTLPDGSTVKINANTRLSYPEGFDGDKRMVNLSGEAFFQIVKDPAHPFVITTSNASVEVLGTSFNVSAYPDERKVMVDVETGTVKLIRLSDDTQSSNYAILPAGRSGWFDLDGEGIEQKEQLRLNYSSWISKNIIFQRTPLAEAFSVLENTYHVTISTESSDIGTILYTANFANLDLDYILNVISITHKLEVKRDGDHILFSKL